MARRTIQMDGETWRVYITGRLTPYDRDEFGLVFEMGTGSGRVRRVSRFSPTESRSWDAALAALSERSLSELFRQSQLARTSPVAQYGRP